MKSLLVPERPILSRDEMFALAKKMLSMATATDVDVYIIHTARTVTRLANGQVLTSDDGDEVQIGLYTAYGNRIGVRVDTNQIDDTALREIVQRCEAISREQIGGEDRFSDQNNFQDTYVPVHLWHDATIKAMRESRETVLPGVLKRVAAAGMQAAGFVGFMAKAVAFMSKEKIQSYYEETDSEITVSARTPDGKSSGWAGQAARDWSKVDYAAVAARSIDIAKQWVGAQALEPGRRTAILTSEAVAQLFRYFAQEYSGGMTVDWENTIFTKPRHTAHYNERMFDPRITMSVDPADPDGGFAPFFWRGYANPATTLTKDGVLKDLAFDFYGAMIHGRKYSDEPSGLRVSGGTTSVEEMISKCREGIFVNRFSGVDMVDMKSMMLSGVTRDGCFLVKDGKITKPVKNFRFLESPAFMLNKLVALGATRRAAYGYTPPGVGEFYIDWPRRPIIVPPMMVNDFNFSALADAV